MKPRIRMDMLMMGTGVVLTLLIFQFPSLYPQNRLLDDLLDFIGVLLILKGIFFRMVARGHKKRLSKQSQDLVTTGPYKIVRNPMYLGTYLIGAGFFLALCPWWVFPVYSIVFYRRFRRQILQEEKLLQRTFGERYDDYCQRVPRVFPDVRVHRKIRMREIFPWADAWTTKEKRAIIPALIAVFGLEIIQEKSVFGTADILITLLVVFTATAVFGLGLWVRYQENS